MPEFDVEPERIVVFRVDEEYYFSHYFERTDLFEALQEYYDGDAYRFEVPADAFDEVRSLLEDNYYAPDVVEDLEPFCVVVEKYEPHAAILRNSVVNWERRGHRFFVMADDLAAEQAVEQGATRLAETDFVLGI